MSNNIAAPVTGDVKSINREEGLRREISMWGLTANLINIIVGAGIFVLPATVALRMGPESIVAYLFCGFLMLLVVLCYAEVGSKVTTTGGSYAFIYAAFGKLAGFITLALFFVSVVTADAAVSNALFELIAALIPSLNTPWFRWSFLAVMFLGLGYLNILGVKEGITLVKITTIGKLTPLVILIVAGVFFIEPANLAWESMPVSSELASISLLLFFAFQGAESGLTAGGEIKNPQKTVPRALLISIFVILGMYILIQLVSFGVLGSELKNYTEYPLAETAGRFMGPTGFTLLFIGAAISMFGNISGEILNAPRVFYGAARDRTIPIPILSRIHERYRTPYIAIAFYVVIGLTLAISGGFVAMAIASNSAILLIYMGIAASVIKLRIKGSHPGGFRIPGGYVVPVLAIIVICWFISGLETIDMLVGGGFILLLFLLYFILHRNGFKSQN